MDGLRGIKIVSKALRICLGSPISFFESILLFHFISLFCFRFFSISSQRVSIMSGKHIISYRRPEKSLLIKSNTVKKLLSDFDIFSPSIFRKPLGKNWRIFSYYLNMYFGQFHSHDEENQIDTPSMNVKLISNISLAIAIQYAIGASSSHGLSQPGSSALDGFHNKI